MKIQVRIHSENGTTRVVDVPTGKKITTFITPEEGKFNFELLDLETGFAPNTIVAKRQGNDLAITFDNADQADLIIEGYYNDDDQALIIGLAEDGNYYAYIPASGLEGEAIPNLPEAVLASEVLGGQHVGVVPFVFPFWKGLLGAGAAAVAIAAVAAVTRGDSEPASETTPANNEAPAVTPVVTPEVTPVTPSDRTLPTPSIALSEDGKFVEVFVDGADTVTGDKLVINVVEKGNTTPTTVELTKNEDGSWSSNNPTLVPDVVAPSADENGNVSNDVVVKIPADLIEPNTDITAIIVDQHGNSGEQAQDILTPNPQGEATTPTVVANPDGSVTVTVPNDKTQTGDKAVIQLVEKGNTTPTIVNLEKQEDGSWVSDNPDLVPSIPAGEDSTTISADKIEPGSTVAAHIVSKDGLVGEDAQDVVQPADDLPPEAPVLTAKKAGSMEVALPETLDENDVTLVVEVLETGKESYTTVTLTKDAEGNWISDNPALVPNIASGEKATLIDGAKISDTDKVFAQLFDKANNASSKAEGTPDNVLPTPPTVTPSENGSITITVPNDKTETGDKLVIELQEPDKEGTTIVTLEKQEDGSWTSDNETIVPPIKAGEDSTVIDGKYIKDGTDVIAKIVDAAGNEAQDEAKPDSTPPAAPEITANKDGSVTIKLPESALNEKEGAKLNVTITDKDGNEIEKATLTKDADGNWVSDNPSVVPSIPANSDSTTIPAEKLPEGSKVTANIVDAAGNVGPADQAEPNQNNEPVPNPKVEANDDGSVSVIVPIDANTGDKVEVVIEKPNGEKNTYELTKNEDGSWTSSNPAVLPDVPADHNTSVIPAAEVPPGTKVTATTVTKDGERSDNKEGTAVDPVISPVEEPTLSESEQGEVVIKPAEGNTKLTVAFEDEDGNDQTLVIEQNPETGKWETTTAPSVPVTVDEASGTITIHPDSIQDGSKGTITAQTGNRPENTTEFTAPQDAQSSAPIVSAGEEPGSITVEPGQGNTTVTVVYTDEENVEHTVTISKDPESGEWTAVVDPADSGVTIDPTTGKITIAPNSLKDGEPVKASGQNGNNPVSETVDSVKAGVDNQSPSPKLSQDDENLGGVIVEPSAGNDKVTVNYQDESGIGQSVVATKDPETQEWALVEPKDGVSIDPVSGVITFEPNAVLDDSEVTATAQNGNNPESAVARVQAHSDTPSVEPNLDAKDDGSVEITPDMSSDEVLVVFTDENGDEQNIIATKDPETNEWSLEEPIDGVSIDPSSGKITIEPDAVKDGSEVTASAISKGDPQSAQMVTEAKTDAQSKAPSIMPQDNGAVIVTPDPENTALEVTFKDEEDVDQTAAVEKNQDGVWVPTFDLPNGVTVDPETGAVTISPNAVKDGEPVSAQSQTHNNEKSVVETLEEAPTDPQSDAPSVTEGEEQGAMVVTPAEGNTKVIVTYTDENDQEQSIEINKNNAGQWSPVEALPEGVSLDADSGVITLSPDSVKDGKNVTAKGQNANDPESVAESKPAATDAPSKAPMISEGSEPGSVEITPADGNTEVSVNFTDEKGMPQSVTAVKNPETGKWEPTGELPKDVTVNPDSGKITLNPDAVKEGTPVTATGTSGNNPSTATDGSFTAGEDPISAAPEVVNGAEEGSVDIIPADGNTEMTVHFTDENDQAQSVVVAQGDDGKWAAKDPVPEGVTVDPETGRVTLDPNAVKDGTPVTATGKSGDNPESVIDPNDPNPFTAPDDKQSEKPNVSAGREAGSVEITPNPENTTLNVEFTDENGDKQSFTIAKDENGDWNVTDGVKPEGVEVNPVTGKVTLSPDSVKDDAPVTATAQSGDNPVSDAAELAVAGDDSASAAPTAARGDEQGSVVVTPDESNDQVLVTFTDENEMPQSVLATKVDGVWTLPEADQAKGASIVDGKIVLEPNAVLDGSEVVAVGISGNNPKSAEAKVTAAIDPQSAQPQVVNGAEEGSIEVMPGEGNDKVTITYTPEDSNEPKTIVATKENGVWTLPDDVTEEVATIDPVSGKITLKPDAVKDNTPVTVTGQNGNDPVSTTTTTTTADKQSDKPADIVTGEEEGSVVITPADDNTKLTITYTDEEGNEQTLVATKENGVWSLPEGTPESVATIEPASGTITLQPNAVADGSPVKVVANNGNNPDSVEVVHTAGQDKQSATPMVEKDTANQGGVVITPVNGNTSLTVGYTDEDNQPQSVKAEKQGDTWVITQNTAGKGVEIDPASGEIKLAPNSVKDLSEVFATAQDGNNPVSEEATVTADNDPQSAQPILGKGDETGSVTVTPAEDRNTKVTVSYVDEEGKAVSFTVAKGEDGNWAPENLDDVPVGTIIDKQTGKVTIPANNIQDGSVISAVGQDGNNLASTPATATADEDGQSEQPTAEESATEPGALVITPNPENTRMVIEYTDENGQKRTVDVEKNPQTQKWAPKLGLPDNVELDEDKGIVTLKADALQDGEPVKVQGQDGNDPLSDPIEGLVAPTDGNSNPPVITKGDEQGSAKVTPGAGNTRVTVSYDDENGTPVNIEASKDPISGKWTPSDLLPEGVTLDPDTGVISIANENLKDESPVNATGQKGNDPEAKAETYTTEKDPQSPQPEIKAGEEQGSAVITPAEGNTLVKFTFWDEGSEEFGTEPAQSPEIVAQKVDGRWSIVTSPDDYDSRITIDPITGEITIPADLLSDNAAHPVRAQGQNGSNPESDWKEYVPGVDAQSDMPTVSAGTQPGSVTITPHKDNTKVSVEFVKNGAKVPVEANKQPDGTWALKDQVPGVSVDQRSGVITIVGAEVDDGSTVTATGQNGNNPVSEPASGVAGNDNASPAPSIAADADKEGGVIITPEATNTKLEVTFTDENGQEHTVTVEKPTGSDKWVARTDLPSEVTFNEDTGAITLAPNAVKDESEVKAKGTSPDKEPSAEVKAIAGVDERSPQPTITDGRDENNLVDGSVIIKPTEPSDKLTVDYINEAGNPVKIELEKDATGAWKPKADTTLPSDVTLNENDGTLTLSPDAVRDGSRVSAVGQNGDNPASLPATHQAAADGKSDEPMIESILDPRWLIEFNSDGTANSLYKGKDYNPDEATREQQGGAYITPHENNTSVELKWRDETGQSRTAEVVKGTNGQWSVVTSPKVEYINPEGVREQIDALSVDPISGKITLMPDAVLDGSTVEVTGRNGNNPRSATVQWAADPDRQSDQPEVVTDFTKIGEGAEQGSVAIIPHARNTRETITYTDEENNPVTINTVKGANGQWVFEGDHPDGVTLDPVTGKVVIPADKVKDVSSVFAKGQNGNNPLSEEVEGQSTVDKQSTPPTIAHGEEQGSVVVTPDAKNVQLSIGYRDEFGNRQNLFAQKDATGKWAFNNREVPSYVSIDPLTGKVTIAADGVLDANIGNTATTSEVTATAFDGFPGQVANVNPESPSARLTPHNDKQSEKPSISDARVEGGVVVEPGVGNSRVTITYTNEEDRTQSFNVKKNNAGVWSFDSTVADGITIEPSSGRVTFSPNTVKDGSEVKAVGVSYLAEGTNTTYNPVSETATHTAANDAKSPMPVIADNKAVEQGSVTVTPTSPNEKMVVNFTNEAGVAQSVTVIKNGTDWKFDGNVPSGVTLTNVKTGQITIAADSLQDGSEVSAIGYNPNKDPESDKATLTAPEDAKSVAPVINGGTEPGSVEITPTNAKNTKMTVVYEDENGTEHTLSLEKVRVGNSNVWRYTTDSERPEGVTITASTGKVTIAPDSVKDGSTVKAQTQSGNDPVSDWTENPAGEDARSPAPTIAAAANGSVSVTADPNDTYVKVDYVDENDQPQSIAMRKNGNVWVLEGTPEEGVTLSDPTNGVITIAPNSVKDGSDVTAFGQKGNDPVSETVKATAGNDPQSKPPVVTPVVDGEDRGAVVVTPDEENTELTVTYRDENGQVQSVKAELKDGEWQITDGNDPLVKVDPASGAITLAPNAVEDGSTVRAVSRTHNDPISAERTGVAARDAASPAPSIAAGEEQGSVVITPNMGERPNTANTINFVDENNQNQSVTTRKGADGKWTITSPAIDGVSIDPETGAVTLAPNSVRDNSTVRATGISGNDPVSATVTGQAGVDAQSPAPSITPVTSGANQGGMEIMPHADNTSMIVKYRDEENNEHTLNAMKGANGWTLANTPEGVSIDPNSGKVTIAAESVLDRSQVTAQGQNGNDPISREVTENAPLDAQSPAPTVAKGTTEQGSMTVTPATGNTKNTIEFTDENNNSLTLNTVKEDGVWKFVGNAFGAQINPTSGVVTLPADLVKDESTVFASGQNGTNPVSGKNSAVADIDATSPQPTITAGSEQGSVVVSPDSTNTRMVVNYTDEADQPQSVIIAKNSAGQWAAVGTLPTGVSLDRANGNVSIEPNSLKDNSDVTATGQNGNNPISPLATGTAAEDAKSPAPTVTPIANGSNQGAVVVTPTNGNTKMFVEFTTEEDRSRALSLEKNEESGLWRFTGRGNSEERVGVTLNPTTGALTIAPDSVKDGSTVKATAQNGNNPISDEASDIAPTDPQSPAPTISAGTEVGSLIVTPHRTNTKANFTYEDEQGNVHTVNLEKVGNQWQAVGTLPSGLSLNPNNGAVTIAAESLQDESTVSAQGQNGNDPISNVVTEKAPVDATSPAPTISAGTEAGSVLISPAAGNTKETITYTDEQDGSHTVSTELVNGRWVINGSAPEGVTINPTNGVVTIAPESVKDGSTVTAIGQNGNNPVSDLARGVAGSDAASPTPTFANGTEQGSVIVSPAEGNTRMVVNFTAENNRGRSLEMVKENGQWRFEPAGAKLGVSLDPTSGALTIAADSVLDSSIVTATGQNGNNPISAVGRHTAPVDARSPAPEVAHGSEQGSVTVTPVNGNTTMTVRFIDENGNNRTVTINKTNNTWAFNGTNTFGATVDAATGRVTLPADSVRDQTQVTATAQNGNNPVSTVANIVSRPDLSDMPSVSPITSGANKGAVTVTPHANNTANTITYTNELGETQSITIAKNAGTWAFTSTSFGATINPTTGAVTLPANNVMDESVVKATGQNGNNPVSAEATGTAAIDAQSPAPTITPITSGANQGAVTLTPNSANTKATFNYIDENDVARTINVVKDGSSWRFDGDSFGATINRNTGAVTIPAEGVKDGSRVTATGQNGNDPVSTTTVGTAPNDPQSPPPVVTPINSGADQGAVEVTPANGNTSMRVTFTTEADRSRTVSAVKEDGVWKFSPAAQGGVSIDPTSGKITIAADSVKDGSTVTATGQNGNNPVSVNATGVAATDATSPPPSIDAGEAQGSVVVNPGNGNTLMTVNFIDENGNNRTINAAKTGNNWALNGNTFGATIDSSSGEITIPAQGVRDLSLVTATGQNGNNPVSIVANGTAPVDPKSPAPTIAQGTEQGSITVTPQSDNTTMTVKYTDEQNVERTLTLAKNNQGNWAFTSSVPSGVTVEAATGKVTIPALNVKDNSRVEAQSQNTNDPISDWANGFAGNNPVVADKLTVALRSDSGSSNTDRITNDGRILVNGVPDGQAWEYSYDGGVTWHQGGVGGNGQEFFDLPLNNRREGLGHGIKARLSGSDQLRAMTESDQLNMTYDHVAQVIMTVDAQSAVTANAMRIVGNKEDGSSLAYRIGRLNPNTTPLREIEKTSLNASSFPDVGFDANYIKSLTDRNGINGYSIVETDKAGNVAESALPNVQILYHLKGNAHYGNAQNGAVGTSGNDVLVLSRSASEGDGVIKNANMDTGARVNLGDGDDYFYMGGTMYAHTYVDMGAGNDYFNVNELASPASPLQVQMGTGNDTMVIRTDYGARNYAVYGTETIVNLGSGNDTLIVQGNNNKFASPGARLLGGDGYDTLIAESTLTYQTRAQIEYNEIHAITGFEKLIMRKTGSFLVDSEFLRNNHDANNIFTVEGTGRLFTTGGYSIQGTVQTDGHTYQVVNTGGYTVLVEQGITVL